MYRSEVDAAPQELTFEFDPLRPCHAHDGSSLAWPEFPYKQVVIDKLCGKFTNPRLSQEAAAGALLIARGDWSCALFEVEQLVDHDNHVTDIDSSGAARWSILEDRFRTERDAFRKGKRDFLKREQLKVATKIQSIAQRKKEEEDRVANEAWRKRQIVKRYDNGSKYDGEGVNDHGVVVPHGHGTLWVPLKETLPGGDMGDTRRVPRYVGQWMDGFMHGHGTYHWHNGDSWEGNFCRNELQGKGIFTLGSNVNGEAIDASRAQPKEQRVRYYDASCHVCWGDELVRGCRLQLFANRLYGNPLASVSRHRNVELENESECVIVQYDEARDQHLVRKGGTEDKKWISLANTNFQVLSSRPIARYEPSE